MATEKTLEILKKMKADPKAKELFDGMEKPKSPDEAISAYAQIAEKLGYGITADDIKEVVKQEESRRKANTDKVVADMQELKDDDLEDVAGGFYCIVFKGDKKNPPDRALLHPSYEKVYNQCRSDYVDTNCWRSDACSATVHYYYDCSGKYFANGAENDCIVSQFWW